MTYDVDLRPGTGGAAAIRSWPPAQLAVLAYELARSLQRAAEELCRGLDAPVAAVGIGGAWIDPHDIGSASVWACTEDHLARARRSDGKYAWLASEFPLGPVRADRRAHSEGEAAEGRVVEQLRERGVLEPSRIMLRETARCLNVLAPQLDFALTPHAVVFVAYKWLGDEFLDDVLYAAPRARVRALQDQGLLPVALDSYGEPLWR
jgi:hypothetical protein